MTCDTINQIRLSGFRGFVSISALQASKCRDVPDERGVYLVLQPIEMRPVFLSTSTGGNFKGKDPTVPVDKLKNAWIENPLVLYVGKAGGAPNGTTLRNRLCLYMRFGRGAPVGHWGGRYIWQLKQSGGLKVCWRPTPHGDPRELEKRLIQVFKAAHDGRRPFANLRD